MVNQKLQQLKRKCQVPATIDNRMPGRPPFFTPKRVCLDQSKQQDITAMNSPSSSMNASSSTAHKFKRQDITAMNSPSSADQQNEVEFDDASYGMETTTPELQRSFDNIDRQLGMIGDAIGTSNGGGMDSFETSASVIGEENDENTVNSEQNLLMRVSSDVAELKVGMKGILQVLTAIHGDFCLPALMKLSGKAKQQRPSIGVKGLDVPWTPDSATNLIYYKNNEVMLKAINRRQFVEEVLRMQNTPVSQEEDVESGWTEPVLEGPNGEKKGLKPFIVKYLGHMFHKVDHPKKMGIAVAQALWSADHFSSNHMETISSVDQSANKTGYVRMPKQFVPKKEQDLWKMIMLYCGGGLFVRKPNLQDDVWAEWLNRGRSSVNHRGIAAIEKEDKPAVKTKRLIADTIPLFERDFAIADHWVDFEEEQQRPPSPLE